ncbi:GDP-L-fucose synthase [Brevundimonas subvibrioides]|uniref:NAD-dependent epimerase/dehydratase family protein n=1 Tax=Brevundimonas subvibrioides TaxID=74313 RepID=UPI0032D594FD
MIVITGASGVLGRALTEHLRATGEDVVALSSADVDLCDGAATSARMKQLSPRIVFHVAGRVHGLGGNSKYPAEMYFDNIRINSNVVHAAYEAKAEKIVAVSTIAIYSSDAPRPVSEASIWEGRPHASEAAYAHAKRAMLAQLEAYKSQYGLAYSYPIMTNIYGPHDRFDPLYGHVVPSLVAKFHAAAQNGGTVGIWGTGAAERDFIYADDAAIALAMIAERHEGPINVATGKTVLIRDIVSMLQEVSGVQSVEWDATKPDGQLVRDYDISRLNDLGFEPQVSLREGLERTYEWYARAYPNVRV